MRKCPSRGHSDATPIKHQSHNLDFRIYYLPREIFKITGWSWSFQGDNIANNKICNIMLFEARLAGLNSKPNRWTHLCGYFVQLKPKRKTTITQDAPRIVVGSGSAKNQRCFRPLRFCFVMSWCFDWFGEGCDYEFAKKSAYEIRIQVFGGVANKNSARKIRKQDFNWFSWICGVITMEILSRLWVF